MYRESQESFARSIEQLEAELAEARALHRPRRARERTLWAAAAIGVLGGLLSAAACASAHARAEMLERRWSAAAARFQVKTSDLGTCEALVEQRELALQQCRIDRWQVASAR